MARLCPSRRRLPWVARQARRGVCFPARVVAGAVPVALRLATRSDNGAVEPTEMTACIGEAAVDTTAAVSSTDVVEQAAGGDVVGTRAGRDSLAESSAVAQAGLSSKRTIRESGTLEGAGDLFRCGRAAVLLPPARRPLRSPGGAEDGASHDRSVSLPEVRQQRCSRRLSACSDPHPGAVRKRLQAGQLGAGGAQSSSRGPGRRAAATAQKQQRRTT